MQSKEYYREKYFPKKINNEVIVNCSAKRLANLFRNSNINQQMNVPLIGAVMLCIKYGCDIDLTSTTTIIDSVKQGINSIIRDEMSLNKRQKRELIVSLIAKVLRLSFMDKVSDGGGGKTYYCEFR